MVYKPAKKLENRNKSCCDKPKPDIRTISVGVKIEQKPWTPTVRKGRILAEVTPGVPSYQLVPPLIGPNIIDSTKTSAPAYSLYGPLKRRIISLNEGPGKYNVSGVTKRGIHTAPAFSLKSRPTELKKFIGPAPNRYESTASYVATTKTIPKFSFGKRPLPIKILPTPGANVYNLPPVLGTSKEGKIPAAPAFSLIGRQKPRQIPALVLPGPGRYENKSIQFLKTKPKYSFHIKHKVVSDEHMKPGPAAHCPEKYIKHKSVPAPSFAIRHTPFKAERKAFLIPECTPMPPIKPTWIL